MKEVSHILIKLMTILTRSWQGDANMVLRCFEAGFFTTCRPDQRDNFVAYAHTPCINITAAYLQTLLLTGARPGEILEMRWEDLNIRWKGLTIRDKVEGERTIPLTPYVASLLAALPRRSEWVFSSSVSIPEKTQKPISKPHEMHNRACAVAGIECLTLHGLRRSFKSLTEWLDCPTGVVAQIMGHKPSATAEKHYTVRPLDLLRIHHERIEAWLLVQAGIEFQQQMTTGLRAVA
jgi:integrase